MAKNTDTKPEAMHDYLARRIRLGAEYSTAHAPMPQSIENKLVLRLRRNHMGTGLWHCKRTRGLDVFYLAHPSAFAVGANPNVVLLPLEEGGSLFAVVSSGMSRHLDRPIRYEWFQMIKHYSKFCGDEAVLAPAIRELLHPSNDDDLPTLREIMGTASPKRLNCNQFFHLQNQFAKQLAYYEENLRFDTDDIDSEEDSDDSEDYDSEEDDALPHCQKRRRIDDDNATTRSVSPLAAAPTKVTKPRPLTPITVNHNIFDDEFGSVLSD